MSPLSIALLCTTLVAVYQQVSSETTACSQGKLHTAGCLAAVKQLFQDQTRFWYGQPPTLDCSTFPNSFAGECTNKDKDHHSIMTRVRYSQDNSVDVIKQVLNVTYDIPAGTYQSCDNTWQVPAVRYTLDPLIRTKLSLWTTDHPPQVNWRSEPNKVYSLLLWDTGAAVLHSWWANIRGSNLDTAQIVRHYRGPMNPHEYTVPYVFLLYEQKSEVSLQAMVDGINNILTKTRFIDAYKVVNLASLTGPIGVSSLELKTDLYASAYMYSNRIINECPGLLTPKFQTLPLSYDVKNTKLKSWMDVTYTSPETSFRSCCQNVDVPQATRVVNPVGNGKIEPVFTRNAPNVAFSQYNFGDGLYWNRNYYTLLLLDVTDELAHKANPNTVLQWSVINIREGTLVFGDTAKSYQAPLPLAEQGERTYLFLLLQQNPQPRELKASDVTRFAGTHCPQGYDSRCNFDYKALINNLGMQIEAASWFKSSADAYSRRQAFLQRIQTESAACSDVREYSSNCQDQVCFSTAYLRRISDGSFGSCANMLLSQSTLVGR